MRELTKKQKTLLTQWVKESGHMYSYTDLSIEQWNQLVSINDNELLAQNTNRFIMDLIMRGD